MKSASGMHPPDEAHGNGEETIRPQQRCLGKSFGPCTLGIQFKNHEKRFWQASSRRSTRPRRRNHQTATMQRGLGKKRKESAHGHAALSGRVGSALIQKIKHFLSCDAMHVPGWCISHSALQVRVDTAICFFVSVS